MDDDGSVKIDTTEHTDGTIHLSTMRNVIHYNDNNEAMDRISEKEKWTDLPDMHDVNRNHMKPGASLI